MLQAPSEEEQIAEQIVACFNGHPPLGVNATGRTVLHTNRFGSGCFNGHPPLGVNATSTMTGGTSSSAAITRFNGHPPLGVNATKVVRRRMGLRFTAVSMGTHPWG